MENGGNRLTRKYQRRMEEGNHGPRSGTWKNYNRKSIAQAWVPPGREGESKLVEA